MVTISRHPGWYEHRALEAAHSVDDPIERRKHLHVAWRTRVGSVQRTVPATFGVLEECCVEGAELLGDPCFEDLARQLAHVAANLELLKKTPAAERVFMLMDDSSGASQFTFCRIESFDEAYKRKMPVAPPYSPIGVQLTTDQVIAKIRRIQPLSSLGDAGLDPDPATVQVARLPLPWRVAYPEVTAPVESWVGTMLVGERAVFQWAQTTTMTDARAVLFASQLNALRETEAVCYNKDTD